MSHPGSYGESFQPESTLLHSEVLVDQLVKLNVVARALRSSSDPDLVQLADHVVQHCGLLTEELHERGDEALLPRQEEPDYTGKKAIYIKGVTADRPYLDM